MIKCLQILLSLKSIETLPSFYVCYKVCWDGLNHEFYLTIMAPRKPYKKKVKIKLSVRVCVRELICTSVCELEAYVCVACSSTLKTSHRRATSVSETVHTRCIPS